MYMFYIQVYLFKKSSRYLVCIIKFICVTPFISQITVWKSTMKTTDHLLFTLNSHLSKRLILFKNWWEAYAEKQPPEMFYEKAVLRHLQAYNSINERLQCRCFPVKLAKFLRTPILKNICKRLLLYFMAVLL